VNWYEIAAVAWMYLFLLGFAGILIAAIVQTWRAENRAAEARLRRALVEPSCSRVASLDLERAKRRRAQRLGDHAA